jgi:Secretion system C-terminal sorting domain
LAILLCLISFQIKANRALYVDGFSTILGDVNAENQLLDFCLDSEIRKLLLYEMHLVHAQHDLSNPSTNQLFADFIFKAKTQYGVLEIGVVGETSVPFLTYFSAYNNSRSVPEEKIDVFNLEFEFWINSAVNPGGYYCTNYLQPNGFTCDVNGAFAFYMQELNTIKSLADSSSHLISVETYVGWPSMQQAQNIVPKVDLLLLHAYVSDPNTAFAYTENRLIDFGSTLDTLPVSIIYSGETTFMNSWLLQHDMLQAEDIFLSDFSAGINPNLSKVDLRDFTYFAYSHMENVVLDQYVGLGESTPNKFVILPNPASDYLTIQTKGSSFIKTLEMFDLRGVSVYKENVDYPRDKLTVSTVNLKAGLYYVVLNEEVIEKFVVSH